MLTSHRLISLVTRNPQVFLQQESDFLTAVRGHFDKIFGPFRGHFETSSTLRKLDYTQYYTVVALDQLASLLPRRLCFLTETLPSEGPSLMDNFVSRCASQIHCHKTTSKGTTASPECISQLPIDVTSFQLQATTSRSDVSLG